MSGCASWELTSSLGTAIWNLAVELIRSNFIFNWAQFPDVGVRSLESLQLPKQSRKVRG